MFVSDIRQEFSICRLQFSKKAKKVVLIIFVHRNSNIQ